MTIAKTMLVFGSAAAIAGCSLPNDLSPNDQNTAAPEPVALGTLMLADGSKAGFVRIIVKDGTPWLEGSVSGIAPGRHGFHLHQTGICEAPDFKSANGHLNPTGNRHGKLAPGGRHVGDLPNLEIDETGSASLRLALDAPADQLLNWIFDADGTALMIHEKADDYKTDPTGAAGGRIACAIFERG